MRVKFSIVTKLTLLVVGAVTLTALAVNESYVQATKQILIDRALTDLRKEAEFFQYPLAGRINELTDDAELISSLSAVKALIRAQLNGGVDPEINLPTERMLASLTTTITEMMRTREQYLQIRLIGVADGGQEMLRVVRFGNRIERTPDDELQQRADTDFFQETIRLQPGDIFLSQVNLNKEYGKVSLPHSLVLRAAVPIFRPDNSVFGIVVINLDAGQVFHDIRKRLTPGRALYLVNARGDYLVHPDRSVLFATDLGHDRRIQSDRPQLANVMGDIKQEEATFLPTDEANGNVLTFTKYHYDPRDPYNYLGIAVEAPYAAIVAKTGGVQTQGYLLSSAIALIAAAASIILLRMLLRPLNRVADSVVRYRRGEQDIALPVNSPDELGVLAREFAGMIQQKRDEDWARENLLAISRNLLGFKELSGFAATLMEMLTPTVGAQVGVLYVSSSFADERARTKTETLMFLAGWGFAASEGEGLPCQIKWGEGLVGACARSRTRMLINDVQEDYLRISTALGEAKPRHVLLLPVLFENTPVGVIELATVGAFSDVQIAFLDSLSFNLGFIMNAIAAGMRTQKLLEETRQIAEELQRNEEELKAQQEELAASNEEMEEKNKALEQQNARIRQQREQLEENKRMIEDKIREVELASKYKSEFLANMSHELRTPLNSLLILARDLSLNEEGNLTNEQVEEARVIHNGGLELLSLINDILDLSKVEAGKINITVEDVQLGGLVKKLSEQFRPITQESGLPFEIRVDERLRDTLRTDGQRLEQILKNLLSNAFKFTKTGSVTLDIHRTTAAERQFLAPDAPASIAFSVIDTGIGIEQSKLTDIFEAFQQENGSIDRHFGGTGLGLTIARKLTHLLKGEIHVQSEKGHGSIFTLFLPFVGPDAEQPARATVAPEIAEDTRVPLAKGMPKAPVPVLIPDDRNAIGSDDKVLLIIEDDPECAGRLMKLARKRGYKCLAAGDGKTGLILAIEQPVTAVLLDLELPDMNGMRVLDQLKYDLRTRHIPVHIIKDADTAESKATLWKGAIGFVTKPIQQEQIDHFFGQIETQLCSTLKRVLVVEDDKGTQAAIQSLLKHKTVEIVVAETGQAALAELQAAPFDCIILDLKLPDMTGFEWLETSEKATGDGETPPIIIYTAKELTEEENRALSRYTGSIVIKGVSSSERLLDEVTLFLHSIEATLSKDQQTMIRMQHDPDHALQDRAVLLVDDDLRNTFALSKLLKKHGMKIVLADNGQMALEKLREEKAIELVIMDIMMPVMDGYQAMREIRANPEWQHLPIIALTARAVLDEQERCIEAGANDYLVKPVDIERLLTLLRVWLFKKDMAA